MVKDGKYITKYDTIIWYKKYLKHSYNDKPAVIFENGTKWWYKDGKRHRDNGPAIIWNSGDDSWYKDGHQLGQSEVKRLYRENRLKQLLS